MKRMVWDKNWFDTSLEDYIENMMENCTIITITPLEYENYSGLSMICIRRALILYNPL